uniref:Uncharacterized protein n=1 Tax=Russula griseocarnosa TaxID=466936 RepID=A0A650AWJ3_9AGAM|nr:hypothetical protein [Russula griseocarnosa]
MNLQKYSKNELIQMVQKIEKIQENKNPQSKFMIIYSSIKSYVITLLMNGVLLHYFRKYKFVVRVLKIFNWIIVSMFGVSVIDRFYNLWYANILYDFFTNVTAYLITTSIFQFFIAINPFQLKEKYSWQKDEIKPRWPSSEIHQKNSWDANDSKQSNRDSKIARWLELKEDSKEYRDNHKEYILLGLLLLLGGACWYYWSNDDSPPGISSIINGLKYGKDKIEEIFGWKRTYNIAASNIEDVRRYLRNPENRNFTAESRAIITDIIDARIEADHNRNLPERIIGNPVDEYNKFLIVKSRIEQLRDKFPDEFQNWMVTSTQAHRLINNVLSNESRLIRALNAYTNLENETLIQQRAWSDSDSNGSRTVSPELFQSSVDTVNSMIQRSDSQQTITPDAPVAGPSSIPPAPPAPPITDIPPIPKTHTGMVEGLQNLKGKFNLKPTKTDYKDGLDGKLGKVLGETEKINTIEVDDTPQQYISEKKLGKLPMREVEITSNKPQNLTESLSQGLNKMKKGIFGDDDDNELTDNHWDDDKISLRDIPENSENHAKIDKIIKSTLHLDSNDVINEIKKEFPNYDENSYRDSFRRAMEMEIDSGKTQKEKDKIKQEIIQADLIELQKTGNSSDHRTIKNAINENYTHSSLMNEIKNKSSMDDLPPSILQDEEEIHSNIIEKNRIYNFKIENDLNEILTKAKSLQSLKDLTTDTQHELIDISSKIKPYVLINKIKELPDFGKNNEYDILINKSVDTQMERIILDNPNLSKKELVEILLFENPENKDEILHSIKSTIDGSMKHWKDKLDSTTWEKASKILMREDLKERETLIDNRTVDQIKVLKHVNKSHSNLLDEIKLKKKSQVNINKSDDSTSHFENTMNLFE